MGFRSVSNTTKSQSFHRKDLIGCSLYLTMPSRLISPRNAAGSGASLNSPLLDSSTGRSSQFSSVLYDWEESEILSGTVMPNSPVRLLQTPTYGRTTPTSTEHASNWEENPFGETRRGTGRLFGTRPSPETSSISTNPYWYHITVGSRRSVRIFYNLLLSSDLAMFFGDELVLENLNVPGLREVFSLTLKIREPNFGTDIQVRQLLLSMNFVEVSTLDTYSGGSIVIQSLWRSRDLPQSW